MRMRAGFRTAVVLLGLALPASAVLIVAAPLHPDNAEAALAAITATVEVERDVLVGQQEAYRLAASEREEALRRLQRALLDLDALAIGEEVSGAGTLAIRERQIAEAEAAWQLSTLRCQEILGRIAEIQERIAGLDAKVASIRQLIPGQSESLTGNWKVSYLPSGNRGTFLLRHTGTIVQGQYQLEGGWKGSLQGTFIDGKILLQRIDSKLGRSSELEGLLSADGRSIRGTWKNYNMTDGAVATGAWTATREED